MTFSSCKAFLAGRRGMVAALAVLMLVGFGVRYYQFNDWLYFKMDQARDAAIIGNAVINGPEYLPLLGPRAGATTLEHGRLRVGPAYYYMQYLSGVLSGSVEPYVFAYPDLFFGVLAIPMLFLLLRLYFNRWTAFGIATLYTLCFIVIQYARFAWNPNTLPFFLFLSFYGLLRFLDETDVNRRYRWLALWVTGMTIGAQLHFFGVFSLIGISGLMLIWHFQLWKLTVWQRVFTRPVFLPIAKYVATALAIALFLYTPAIVSDAVKKGENFHNFFEAMGSKPDKKPLLWKVEESMSQNIRYYCVITTASCVTDTGKQSPLPKVATVVLLIGGLAAALWRVRILPEGIRKNFARLVIVWVAVFSILSIPVASQLRPRFFLVVMAVPFICWGLLFEYASERWKRWGHAVFLIAFAVILGSNMRGTWLWFGEQAASQEKDVAVKRTLILKAKDGVTLGQLQRAADFMYGRLEPGNRLYFYVKPEHVSPLKYLFRLKQQQDSSFTYQPMQMNEDPHAQFFAVVAAGKTDIQDLRNKYPNRPFEIVATEQAGQLRVAEVRFTTRETSPSFTFKQSRGNGDRVFWADIFGIKKTDSIDIED